MHYGMDLISSLGIENDKWAELLLKENMKNYNVMLSLYIYIFVYTLDS